MSVTLQISLAPSDFKHPKLILPHQLSCLATQVDEILLTVDTKKSKGRFGAGWEEQRTCLYAYLESLKPDFPHLKIVPVDYSEDVKRRVSQFFFEAGLIPDKDFRGGPFYSYFFGLYTAENKTVFHLDSDIFLGGRSNYWVKEAVELLQTDPSVFTVAPLPGPPHPEQKLIGQNYANDYAGRPYAFSFAGMSTRLFMLNKDIFREQKLKLKKPSFRNQLKSLFEGNSNADLPEHLISHFMQSHRLKRVDFLGKKQGLWSLHPPYRTAGFYENLSQIITRIEQNDLPADQAGFYDLTDSVCDWSEARERLRQNRFWKKVLKK